MSRTSYFTGFPLNQSQSVYVEDVIRQLGDLYTDTEEILNTTIDARDQAQASAQSATSSGNIAVAARDDALVAKEEAQEAAYDAQQDRLQAQQAAADAEGSSQTAANSAATATDVLDQVTNLYGDVTEIQDAVTTAVDAKDEAVQVKDAVIYALENAEEIYGDTAALQLAVTQAENARDASQAAETLAEKWASEAEDVPVVPGQFSAKHWAAKASEELGQVALKDQNLSDLTDQKQARANLGTFSTVADVQSHHIPASIDIIRTSGYYTPGDGGGAIYRRRPSEPNRPGKIQSADGSWWLFYGDVFNIRAFGAKGDGVTDDTAAVQDAIDASVPVRGVVRVPDGVFRITDTLEFQGRVVMEGDSGHAGTGVAGSILYQEDPTKPLISMYIRDELKNVYIKVNNTDLFNPVQGPPSILVNSGPVLIKNIRFDYAFIGIGCPQGGEGGAVFIEQLTGFVHHRMVYLEGTKSISYIDTVHARPPAGAGFLDETTWAGQHRVLIETHDADGLFGVDWFIFGGKGLYKHSGTALGPNLMTTVSNAGAEYITHGIEIESGSAQSQAVHFNGLYLQTNNREDGEYLVSCESDVRLILTGFVAGHSKGTDHIRVSAGDVSVANSRFIGHSNTNAIRKYPGGKITVSDTVFERTYTLVHFEDGADNVYLDQSNVVSLLDGPVTGQLFNDADKVNGNNHIFIPVRYLDDNLEESTSISEYHPTRDKMVFAKSNIWVHKNIDSDPDDTAGFVASNRNNAGQFVPGPRARFRVRSTGSTPGSESSEAYIENYWQGEWDAPLRLGNTFLQSGSDNQRRLGTAGNRWTEVFAATGAINTSDARAKTPLRPLTEGELKVAIALTRLPGVYQWLDSVAEKGSDNARFHMGVIAQDVKAAFEAEGLDGFRYGVLCYDEWADSPDDKMTAGSRYGIRYDELAQWQAAGWNARLEALEGSVD